MKLKYLFLLFVGFSQAQNLKKVDFSKFDKSGMKTSLLLTTVKPFSVLGQDLDTYGMYGFRQSYLELSSSDTDNRFSNYTLLLKEMRIETTTQPVDIGLILADFEVIGKNAYEKGEIKIINNVVSRHSNNYVFDRYNNTIIAPLTLRKKGLQTIFNLNSKLFVNVTADKISAIKANFDDGKGFVNLSFDTNMYVNYQTEGQKQLVFEIILDNGKKIIRKSSISVTYSNEDTARIFSRAPSLLTATRAPDLAIYGATDMSVGKCEYEIFLSPDGILDKPIFVVDGFDPSDTRNITAVYNLLTYTDGAGVTRNLGDRIRNEEGFDVVIVNFPTYINALNNTIDGGADFIERNALSLVSVIEQINADKIGTEQNVIIGPSMGGLVSRFALRYMEMNGLSHQTRLWVSFDSPHYGANVPIGLQYLFNYFAYGYADSDAVKPLISSLLRSAAAKQMLIDHLDAHTTSIVGVDDPRAPTTGLPLTPTGCPNYRDNFQNRLNSMGFPQTTRNIAMTNGSGVGSLFNAVNGSPVTPGFDLINSNINTGTVYGLNTRAVTFCEYMPNANVQEKIVDVKIQAQIFVWVSQDTFIANAKQTALSNGVDSSPGGLFDILGLGASVGNDPTLTNFLNAMRSGYFSFIPAVSAMGLNVGGNIENNQPNYYHSINLGVTDTPWDGIVSPTSNTTPFVNWFLPTNNEPHVQITNDKVNFIWCEIVKPDYNFALNGSNSIVACNNTDVNFSFNYNGIHGCPSTTTFTATGNPSGSTISFSPNSISEDGVVTMIASNFSPGTYTVVVTPDNNSDKAISIAITINPTNPNLIGTTEYSLDNAQTFIQATAVTVSEGANLELTIPTNLYNGTIEWYKPNGVYYGNTNPIITSIMNNSSDEGIWIAKVSFTNDCSRMAPVDIPFEVIVQDSLGTSSNEFNNLTMYPNPSESFVTISSSNNLKDVSLQILDLRGRVIWNQKPTFVNAKTLLLDVSSLSKGTYFITLENEELKSVKKLLKK